jgi:hypothetical protein
MTRVRILIRIDPPCVWLPGSKLDPDPQHCSLMQARRLVELIYSGEVAELVEEEVGELVALGRRLQLVGILSTQPLPPHHPHQLQEEEEDDVFESEVAVDLSPGAR